MANCMIDLLHDPDFYFWLPMEIEKSEKGTAKTGKRIIQGIASTIDRDLQNETVAQRGIDFSYFLKYGYYNNDHKPGFDNKVGQPTECIVKKEGLWTKGFLWNKHKIADSIWELALALEASQADRQLGFSIQGKVQRRAGRQILRCWVQDIAITTAPINTNTWLDVVKSLNSVPEDVWFFDDSVEISPRLVSPIAKSTCNQCRKAMSKKTFDQAIDEEKMDLKKDKDGCESGCNCGAKALGAPSPVCAVESLEGGKPKKDRRLDEDVKKSIQNQIDNPLEFNECVDLVMKHRRMSRPQARVVTEAVFAMNGLI